MLVNTICQHLSRRIEAGELSNEDVVQIIEHAGGYLNLQTIASYARDNNISYNETVLLFGEKFVIDNN